MCYTAVILWLTHRCPGRIKWPGDPLSLWAPIRAAAPVEFLLKTVLVKYDNLIGAIIGNTMINSIKIKFDNGLTKIFE